MPRDLTWSYFGGDGGELITASVTLGIPHPPGYPLYVILGKAFSFLPIGTIASRYHLFSAGSMAIAVAFISEIANYHYTTKNRRPVVFCLPGVLAAFLFAFTPIVWSQGIIAEVYALNIAVLSAMLWALLTGRKPVLVGFFFGLSITTHLTSLLLLPMILILLNRRIWRAFFFGTATGLLPLILLVVFAMGDSPIIWGKPGDLRDWPWLLSAWLYRSNILNLASISWVSRLQSWLLPLLLPLSIFLIILFVSYRRKQLQPAQKRVKLIFLTAVGYAFYSAGYSTPDAIVLMLPAVLLLAILMAISNTSSRLTYLLLVLMVSLGILYLSRERSAPLRTAAIETLSDIPENAIVITPGDPTVSAAWYFSYAEETRQDLIIVDFNLFQFKWYRDHLWERSPGLTRVDADDIETFIAVNSEKYDVCRLSLYYEQTLDCGVTQLNHDW